MPVSRSSGGGGSQGATGATGPAGATGVAGVVGATGAAGKSPSAVSDITGLQALLEGKVAKPGEPPAYTQTYSTAARAHVEPELSSTLTGLLLTQVIEEINKTNKAVNELKKLANALIDDAQSNGLAK